MEFKGERFQAFGYLIDTDSSLGKSNRPHLETIDIAWRYVSTTYFIFIIQLEIIQNVSKYALERARALFYTQPFISTGKSSVGCIRSPQSNANRLQTKREKQS